MLYAGTVDLSKTQIGTRNKIFIKMSEGKKENWLDKGDGGEWFEPYITNRDMIYIAIVTSIICSIIILCCTLI